MTAAGLATTISLMCTSLLLMLASAEPAFSAAEGTPSLEQVEMIRMGENIYRHGVLPSGKPVQAVIGETSVEGTSFTCTSCHLRSGLGSVEREAVTPPINGRMLFENRRPFKPGSEFVPLIANYAKYLPERPGYTEESLSAAIRTGIAPNGRPLHKGMPRYRMTDSEMASLIAYLKTLSDMPPPGVTADELRFATVIVEGSDPVAVESMLAPIQFSIDRKNSLSRAAASNSRVARMGYNMLGDLSSLRFSLARWTLKGPASTWTAQLESYYRKEPVFALLGGISNGEWEPVHRFCEEHRIPNLFPVVDYPTIDGNSWYTLYMSRGVRQEGETAARYLHTMSELFRNRPVLQIIRGTKKGEALADGFRQTWSSAGHPPVKEIRLAEGEKLSLERLQHFIANQKPAALAVWDDTAPLQVLETVHAMAARPEIVITSATSLGRDLGAIPESLRSLVYVTYPYRLPQDDFRFDAAVKKVVPGTPLESYDGKIIRQSYITGEVLGKALMEMRGEYYRDFLLDTIGMMREMYYPLYERISFGAGDRFASKGCYIVQLGKGPKPRLERRSEWLIP